MFRTLLLCLLILFSLKESLYAQAVPIPVPKQQFFDNNGNPLSGGKLFSFAAGTNNPLATYTDSTASTPNANPVILDSAGRASIFLSTSVAYKFRLETAAGVALWTVDGVVAGGGGGGGAGVTSFNGRSGVVTPQNNDYNAAQITNAAARNASNTFTAGTQDFSQAARTKPAKVGSIASRPPTCEVGEQYFANDVPLGDNLQGCTTPNTWTVLSGSGGSSFPGGLSWTGTPGYGVNNLGDIRSKSLDVDGVVQSRVTEANAGFQVANLLGTPFLVDGYGNILGRGAVNVQGIFNPVSNDNAAYMVNGVTIVDSARDAVFHTLTCDTNPCGTGGGAAFPLADTTNLVADNSDPTKILKFEVGGITTSTVRTATWPDANITVVGRENAETISGAKTFSAIVTGNLGFAGQVFNATGSMGTDPTFQNSNTKFIVDWDGNITASGTVIALGGITSETWLGLNPESSTPGATPGGGFSALVYKGGTSGLEIWLYDVVHSAWASIDLGDTGTGVTSINGQTGPALNINGTTNRVTVSTGTNTLTLTTPQDLHTSAAVTFASVTTSGVHQSTATNADAAFQVANVLGTPFLVDGYGNIGGRGTVNVKGIANPANGNLPAAYMVDGVTVIEADRDAFFKDVTISGNCLGAGCTSVAGTANQILVNGATAALKGAVTLTLPQSIAPTSNVSFNQIQTTGAIQSNVASGVGLQVNNGAFQAWGEGFVNGFYFNAADSFKINGITAIDSSRSADFTGLTVSSPASFLGGIGTHPSSSSVIYIGNLGNLFLRTFSGAPNCSGVQDGWTGYDSTNDILYICRSGVATAH